MDNENDGFFWPSYLDLMISLFFIMLVLFVVSFYHYTTIIKASEEEKRKLEELEKTIEELMKDKNFFLYDEENKRYKVAQEIEFVQDDFKIDKSSIKSDYDSTIVHLIKTGKKLKETIDTLLYKKNSDLAYSKISYTLIITGRASSEGDVDHNYELSYKRAYFLYKFWKENVVNFDSSSYQNIIDLQISGVGVGGLGRYPMFDQVGNNIDNRNRSFFIQIIPKIGEFNK